MTFDEVPLSFSCRGDTLFGILTMPQQARSRAVLIVVGGPQYRAGSHRQFVLLARALASHGYPVMRFDYRGMGDSEGGPRTFEQVDDDLRAAVDQLLVLAPAVREVVIWGLCDGASAALLYAHQDPRISGLVLVNPWAHTEQGEAKARLKHYYRARLLDPALWRKIVRGDFEYGVATRSLRTMIHRAFRTSHAGNVSSNASLPDRLHHGFRLFPGRVLVVLSENDLTAQEFKELTQHSPTWRNLMRSPRIRHVDLKGGNHTFSRHDWRDQVISMTSEWLNSLPKF